MSIKEHLHKPITTTNAEIYLSWLILATGVAAISVLLNYV